MNQKSGLIGLPVLFLTMALAIGGCSYSARERSGDSGASLPPVAIAESQAVVEGYLRAATQADGAEMYALIATSERDEETPQSLRETAADRYSSNTTWKIVKVEQKESTSEVVAEFKGAKVEPNPYTFVLTKEAGEWRIVQSPELHEDDDDIQIKL
jgi:hypothetical protein